MRNPIAEPPDRRLADGIGSFVADGKRDAPGSVQSPVQCDRLFGTRTDRDACSRRGAASDVVFKITDQGRGIPHDVIAHVFDRFHSNTMGSRHRGVGLGLSIVKSFVELHGGSVLIESAPGEGTVVTCMFPARDCGLPEIKRPQGDPPPLRDRHS